MRDEGISDKLISNSTYFEETVQERVNKEMLKLVTDRNGKFHSIPKLLETGRITEAEADSIRAFHNGLEPPYYYITQMHRIYDNRTNPPKQYLTYDILFEGLALAKRQNVVNPEPNLRINTSATLGYHNPAQIGWNTVNDENGNEQRVATFNYMYGMQDNPQSRVYEFLYSRELVEEMLKHTKDGQAGLVISKLREQKHYGVRDVQEFLTDDIEALLEKFEKPPAPSTTNIYNLSPEKEAEYQDYLSWKRMKAEAEEDNDRNAAIR